MLQEMLKEELYWLDTPPIFVGGAAEPFDSQDLEDIVALIDGCIELESSFQEED